MSQALTNIRLKTHNKLASPMLLAVIALDSTRPAAGSIWAGSRWPGCQPPASRHAGGSGDLPGASLRPRYRPGPRWYGCSGRLSKRTILHYPPRTTSSTLDDRQPVTPGNSTGHTRKHRSRYLTAALGTAKIYRIGPSLGTAPGHGTSNLGEFGRRVNPGHKSGVVYV